jgi:hypothetical protein
MKEVLKLSRVSEYLDNIKEYAYKDIAHIQNNVLNKNPYTSEFINNYIFNIHSKNISKLFLFKKIFIYYMVSGLRFILFLSNFIIFKLFWKKNKVDFDHKIYFLDIYFLVDKIILEKDFKDTYLSGLYDILEERNQRYVFLPRLFGVNQNPLKFIKLISILNSDEKNKFLLEYELLNFSDILKILTFILAYPIKQFDIIQPNNSALDKYFNYELFNCLPHTSFTAYTRYLVGVKISKKLSVNSKIFSWQEFQNIEKAFYRAIRKTNKNVFIYGCEFLIKYKNYLSMHITDTDVRLQVVPHRTFTNGAYNYSKSSRHNFSNGVSLRYKKLFNHVGEFGNMSGMLVLLSYNVLESKNLLTIMENKENIKLKLHPTTSEKQFNFYMKSSWSYVHDDLYKLFKKVNIVFVPSLSGSAVEAVACGISVIVIANTDKLLVNSLVDFGKGKIWDIVYNKEELESKVTTLIKYRKSNKNEIRLISDWYRNNFFINPTRDNITKVFKLD